MAKSMAKLKSLNLDLGESSMFKDMAEEGEGEGEEEEEEPPQQCEWEIAQVMDHESAITAIAEVVLKVRPSSSSSSSSSTSSSTPLHLHFLLFHSHGLTPCLSLAPSYSHLPWRP